MAKRGKTELSISIHAPAGGATWIERSPDLLASFQSTLPRGERLIVQMNVIDKRDISIHAPAGGATDYLIYKNSVIVISIHAPAGGATVVFVHGSGDYWDFNPRSRGGSDVLFDK